VAEAPPLELPPIAELLPHAGPMLLLSRVLCHDESATTCEIDLGRQTLFQREDGGIPCWVGVEYMAHCVVAHAGLLARARGEAPRVGFLVSCRRLPFYQAAYPAQGLLEVTARYLRGRSELGALSFTCQVCPTTRPESSGDREKRVLAEGNINIGIPKQIEPLR
jgi:predicted hotdog family 3-hydroxylacyl-ACP dehydratase